jgi:hypothetical protein
VLSLSGQLTANPVDQIENLAGKTRACPNHIGYHGSIGAEGHEILKIVSERHALVHGLRQEREDYGPGFGLSCGQRKAAMANAVANDDDVVLADFVAVVINLITQLARFEDDYLKVIGPMDGHITPAVKDQKSNVDGIGIAKGPHVQAITTDLPVNERIGTFPGLVAF